MNKPIDHPLGNVEWIKPSVLKANGYNPNHVFKPELMLLKISILCSGWTQPIVRRADNTIVDGFHRWSLASKDKDVQALTGGLVPVVTLSASLDEGELQMATVRHNRARGKHSVLLMSEIVLGLINDHGYTEDEIAVKLGMEQEEIARLSAVSKSPEAAGSDTFGKSWVPDKD
jgi:ParB-like chromosome segregation protein Spo0J